jgi:hypothetical protein
MNGYQPCLQGGCSIGIRKTENWIGQDGKYRQAIVAAVELDNGSHAAGGIIGIAIFRWDYVTWVQEVSTPSAMSLGGFGRYRGEVRVLHLPGTDPVFIAHDAGMHQGMIDESDSILLNVLGSYRDTLDVLTAHATGGYCVEAEPSCIERARNDDFGSEVSIKAASDGGFDVSQTFSSGLPRASKTWHIEPYGKAREISMSGNALSQSLTPGAAASFANGVSDRQAYEAWFATLAGDERDGAAFWAEQRSLKNPPSCQKVKPDNVTWTSGCTSAMQHLSGSDAKRKSDPDYRRGWNSI